MTKAETELRPQIVILETLICITFFNNNPPIPIIAPLNFNESFKNYFRDSFQLDSFEIIWVYIYIYTKIIYDDYKTFTHNGIRGPLKSCQETHKQTNKQTNMIYTLCNAMGQ